MPRVTDCVRKTRDERGMSLVVALMASMLLSALGMALVLVTNTESMITSNYRTSSEALYAADAGVERAVQDLLLVPDWNRLWAENLKSSFVNANNCTGTVDMGGSPYNLGAMTAQMQAETDTADDWGLNDPRWTAYACGWIGDLIGIGTIDSWMYVVVWAADDPSENDDDPTKDVNGVVTLRAQSFGPGGTTKTVEVTVARTSSTEIERGQIAQRGQEELNQRARKAAVQTPGRGLSEMRLDTVGGGLVRQ